MGQRNKFCASLSTVDRSAAKAESAASFHVYLCYKQAFLPPVLGQCLSGYVLLGRMATTACAVPFRTTQGEFGIVLHPSPDKRLTLFWCSTMFVLVLVRIGKTACCISSSHCCCELSFTLLQKLSAPVLGESEMPALFSVTETFSKISLLKLFWFHLAGSSLYATSDMLLTFVWCCAGDWNLSMLEFYELKHAQTNERIDAAWWKHILANSWLRPVIARLVCMFLPRFRGRYPFFAFINLLLCRIVITAYEMSVLCKAVGISFTVDPVCYICAAAQCYSVSCRLRKCNEIDAATKWNCVMPKVCWILSCWSWCLCCGVMGKWVFLFLPTVGCIPLFWN